MRSHTGGTNVRVLLRESVCGWRFRVVSLSVSVCVCFTASSDVVDVYSDYQKVCRCESRVELYVCVPVDGLLLPAISHSS